MKKATAVSTLTPQRLPLTSHLYQFWSLLKFHPNSPSPLAQDLLFLLFYVSASTQNARFPQLPALSCFLLAEERHLTTDFCMIMIPSLPLSHLDNRASARRESLLLTMYHSRT